jgi:hypothetical protein
MTEVKRAVPRIPVIAEREKTHGQYAHTAYIAQSLKDILRAYSGWQNLDNQQKESLELITTKIARIVSGNPNEIDHWRDIAGYAVLILESLKEKN